MESIIHQFSKLLPNKLVKYMKPIWHRLQLFFCYFINGGRLYPSNKLQCLIASKYIKPNPNKRMSVAIRSLRELLRWMQFGNDDNQFFSWLASLDEKSILWDVGASNGLEGFYAYHSTNCKVVFIEPYTPSIESIMKTVYLNCQTNKLTTDQYEIVQAACSDHNGFERLITHTKPVAGENYNSIEHGIDKYCQGGRLAMDQPIAHWVKCLQLDDLYKEYNIELPTHLKIDVDGLELLVLKGANYILSSPSLTECVIEVNDNNGPDVVKVMNEYGFKKYTDLIHCDREGVFTADYFFRRET